MCMCVCVCLIIKFCMDVDFNVQLYLELEVVEHTQKLDELTENYNKKLANMKKAYESQVVHSSLFSFIFFLL